MMVLLILMTIGGFVTAAHGNQIKHLGTIQGRYYQLIQQSMVVLNHHKLDLSRYDVLLVRENENEYVILSEIDGSATARQAFGVNEETKAELTPKESARLASMPRQLQELAKINGTSLQAIHAANAVFASRSPTPDLTQYKIEVIKDGHSLVVIFADKDRQTGARGSPPGRPGIEVTLDPHDLRVVRSNFIR